MIQKTVTTRRNRIHNEIRRKTAIVQRKKILQLTVTEIKTHQRKIQKTSGRMPVIPEMPQNPVRHEMQPITARDSNM